MESHYTVFAGVYKDFSIKNGDGAHRRKPAPVAFAYEGVVETVLDPRGVVGGSIVPGQRFTGEIRYDASAPYDRHFLNGHPPYGISFHLNTLEYSIDGLTAEILNNYYYFVDHSLKDFFVIEAHLKPHIHHLGSRGLDNSRSERQRHPSDGVQSSRWSTNVFTAIALDPAGHRLYTVLGRVDTIRRLRD
jgi:hypothetical protein